MYRVRIVENHGHNGDDVSWEDFQDYEDALNYVLNYYFDGDEAQRKLLLAIAELPTKQRQVFNMRYFDEIPYEEMSTILNTSVGALKASYHFAVEKITEYLKKEEI